MCLFYVVQDQLLQAQRNQDLIEEEEYYDSVSVKIAYSARNTAVRIYPSLM